MSSECSVTVFAMDSCATCHGMGWVPEWGPVDVEEVGLLLMLEEFYELVGEPIVRRVCHCTHEQAKEGTCDE